MFDWCEKIKHWYPALWNLQMVKDAVVKGKITSEQFKDITGQPYVK